MKRPTDYPERILVYGGMGSGKTELLLQTARMAVGSGHHVRMIDTDNGIIPFLYSSYSDIKDDVTVYDVDDWEEFESAAAECVKESRTDDWIMVDSATQPWDFVQEYYVQQAFGKTRGEWLLEMKRIADSKKSGDKQAGIAEVELANWNFINPLYMNVAKKLFLRPPCNTIFTAEATSVNEQFDSGETLATFKPYGSKPKGQKRLGFMANSVLVVQQQGQGKNKKYLISTVKERGERPQLHRAEWGNFPQEYLVDVAGWEWETTKAPVAKKKAV